MTFIKGWVQNSIGLSPILHEIVYLFNIIKRKYELSRIIHKLYLEQHVRIIRPVETSTVSDIVRDFSQCPRKKLYFPSVWISPDFFFYKNEEFTFDAKTRTGFSFNFSSQDSGMPELKMKKMMKNRKTPSQIRRNQKRMEIFQQRKKEEATGKTCLLRSPYENV